jgi:hypothetical protein
MEPNSALTFGTAVLAAFLFSRRQEQKKREREKKREWELEARLAFLLEVLPTYEVVHAT